MLVNSPVISASLNPFVCYALNFECVAHSGFLYVVYDIVQDDRDDITCTRSDSAASLDH